jgi:hypothetical protein
MGNTSQGIKLNIALLLSSYLALVLFWGKRRGGSSLATTWLSSSSTWCAPLFHLARPPLLGFSVICYIIKHSPLCKLVGAWVILLVTIAIYLFLIGIKGFGGYYMV